MSNFQNKTPEQQSKEIYETIRNNYATLHYLLYSLLIVKSYKDQGIAFSNEHIMDQPFYALHPYCIKNFPGEITLEDRTGAEYTVRKDIASWASEVEMNPLKYCENPEENQEDRNFGPIQQSAHISLSTQMLRYMYEILKIPGGEFRKYFDDRLRSTKGQTEDFFDVVNFLRHVFVHTKSFDYTIDITESLDMPKRGWIARRGGRKVELKFTIQTGYELDISFETTAADLDGKNLFQIVSAYQIYMLLEVFMIIAREFYEIKK